ncbi:GlsB/YeaQ/YmgE family stress response membrane protein [Myxococcus sp. K15C18031901]|uniref:GlsB/YeaQ/YmgE family stress response membrane protein n=1 Tax=Myxococcus dinghuensis TaxID=2906761 RepID=UPI0020A739C3|nr:GlsB/YeaQ/YmgE family stress response membrane protein [Myxococcus dinghuensis]MCP3104044.1 GlsB/YeaQ/YmgE family stress response membrane protein [Myxococcus dinghuensis]
MRYRAGVKFARTWPPLLVLLLLSGPRGAWGQEATEAEEARVPAPELTPPPLVPISPGDAARQAPEDDDDAREAPARPAVGEHALPRRELATRGEDPVPRIAVEAVGGVAGGAVGGTLGLVAGYLLGAPTVGCDECHVVSLVGGLAGVLVGIPAGTWVGGKVMGGKGTFLATTAGSLVGWGGALLGSAVLGLGDDDKTLAALLLILPLAGATTGYELSQQDALLQPPPTPVPTHQKAVRVMPLAGMTEHGPRLGLMGRF